MDLGFSIVSDIPFITKPKNDHNFGPNLNIWKILSLLGSPGHSQEAQNGPNPLSHNVGLTQGPHAHLRIDNTGAGVVMVKPL